MPGRRYRLGVVHSGVQEEHDGHLIALRDPDNIQLEVSAPGSDFDEGLEQLRSTLHEPRILGWRTSQNAGYACSQPRRDS
jgi:hypothetical protein